MLVAVPVMARTVVAPMTVLSTAVTAIVVMVPLAVGVLLVLADGIVRTLTLVLAGGIVRTLTLVLAGGIIRTLTLVLTDGIVGALAGLGHAGTTQCKCRRDRQKSGNAHCFQLHGSLLHRGAPG